MKSAFFPNAETLIADEILAKICIIANENVCFLKIKARITRALRTILRRVGYIFSAA